jgi:multidrug efflux pump subunit AcrA (membrane-fusion protein)
VQAEVAMSDQILSEPAVVVTPRQVRVRYPGLKTVLIGAGVTIAVAAVLFAPRLLTKPQVAPVAVPAASHAALSVVATPATMQPIARSVIGDGSVVAWQEIVVGFESGGLRVVEVTFDEGDHVKAGQLLARLDDALPIAQLAEAEAAVTEADATAEFARGDFKRAQDLIRGDFMARQTLEQRQSATRQAEARLMAARARRDEAAARPRRPVCSRRWMAS